MTRPAIARHTARRRPRALLVALSVVMMVGGGADAYLTYRAAGGPAAVVARYFRALERGDAATALTYGDVPAGGRRLLSAAVLSGQHAAAPITDFSVVSTHSSGASTTVAVHYRIGGNSPAQVDDQVPVVRAGHRWKLARSAIPIQLSVPDAPAWAAAAGPVPFAVPTDQQLAFPGAVPVVYRSPALTVAATPDRIVRFAGPGQLAVHAAVSTPTTQAITVAIRAALTACARGGATVDPFCPQPADPAASGGTATPQPSARSVPQSFTGTLTDPGRIQVAITVGTATTATLTVRGRASAAGRWQVLDFDNMAQNRSGQTTLTFAAQVPIATPTSITWDRSGP